METSRQEKVRDALSILHLNPEHFDMIENNPAGNNPYHNNEHLYTVALHCHDAAFYHDLGKDDHRVLFLAALYHDYAHTAGSNSDTVNICKSVAWAIHHIESLEDFTAEQMNTVADIIHATIQPSNLHNGSLSVSQKIIRDADMMQWLEPDAEKFLSGLSKEMNQEISWASTKEFLESHIPQTAWGQMKIDSLVSNLY